MEYNYLQFKFLFFVGLITGLVLSSCSYDEGKEVNRVEFSKIAENRVAQELLDDLYIGSDGDVEALARILNVTPSTINRIRKGETETTSLFEKKILEVTKFYYQNDQSFIKLRSILDNEWRWYDDILYFPQLHPYWFWGITIFLVVSTLFYWLSQTFLSVIVTLFFPSIFYNFTVGIYGLIIEGALFFIVWIFSLFMNPSPMEDKYVDTINPVVEQLM